MKTKILIPTPCFNFFRLSSSTCSSSFRPDPIRSKQKTHKMSSSSSCSSIVEHIVLFRFKNDTESEKVSTCIAEMNCLKSIHTVLHLTAGSINRITSPSLFTHILHSRYSSKSDLIAYTNNPIHTSLVQNTLLPICEEIMAVDWINDGEEATRNVEMMPGCGLKIVLMKPGRKLENEEKVRILKAASGNGGVMLSRGENFSPARGKGFSLVSMEVFSEIGEKGVEEEKEMVKGEVGELLEDIIVVHYVLPRL